MLSALPDAQAPDDLTLDELREALAPMLPDEAAFDGWTPAALDAAAVRLGVPADRARLAFPGGAVDMIDAWFVSVDREMTAYLPDDALAAMKVRVRIESLLSARIDIVARQIEALRRALAVLALPANVGRAARLGWRSADAVWRAAGDRATGLAHYSKRLTLASVYGATVLALLADESEDHADTRGFLTRRIGDVMRVETLKMRLKPDPDRHFSPARLLGRLRYPAH